MQFTFCQISPAPAYLPAVPVVPTPGPSAPTPTHTTLSPAQLKFAQSTLRTLRKQKDAYPFNQPVDPVALKIPHYLNVITRPMDFGTIDKKLAASSPAKKPELATVASANEPRYYSVLEFFADLKLVFENCYLFNGPDHMVSQCAKKLEAMVDRLSKNMPPPQAVRRVFFFFILIPGSSCFIACPRLQIPDPCGAHAAGGGPYHIRAPQKIGTPAFVHVCSHHPSHGLRYRIGVCVGTSKARNTPPSSQGY